MESAAANPIWKQICLYTNKGSKKRSIPDRDLEYYYTHPLTMQCHGQQVCQIWKTYNLSRLAYVHKVIIPAQRVAVGI